MSEGMAAAHRNKLQYSGRLKVNLCVFLCVFSSSYFCNNIHI